MRHATLQFKLFNSVLNTFQLQKSTYQGRTLSFPLPGSRSGSPQREYGHQQPVQLAVQSEMLPCCHTLVPPGTCLLALSLPANQVLNVKIKNLRCKPTKLLQNFKNCKRLEISRLCLNTYFIDIGNSFRVHGRHVNIALASFHSL